MRFTPSVRFLPFLPVVLLVLLNGCSIFSSVGTAVSRGYENTISYFNSYYNANRLFHDAEDEIINEERSAQLRGTSGSVTIPPGAKQKLTLVIDKCSNVLSFHPASSLVDDCLFLIGKSYFYQGEYLKAERKFSELLAQYPASSVALEAQLWHLKTLVRLNKKDESLKAAQVLVQSALDDGEHDIAANALVIEGDVYLAQNSLDNAIGAYESALRESSKDDIQDAARMKLGEALCLHGDYPRGATVFLDVAGSTSNPSVAFGANREAVRALRSAGKIEEALSLCGQMLGDYRFIARTKEIIIERGVTFTKERNFPAAIEDFTLVDTSSVRSELGSMAAFQLARLYEEEVGDYQHARDAYARSTMYPVPSFVQEARKRLSALTRYLTLRAQRGRIDSLFAVETSQAAGESFNQRGNPRVLDSLKFVRAINAYDLAEVFYAELEVPDSAVFWYHEALASGKDSVRSPRILYLLAELARSYPEKNYGKPESILQDLFDKFPDSFFAHQAKVQAGLVAEQPKVDPAEQLYQTNEKLIDSGDLERAIRGLETLIHEYPSSPLAPKSFYTIGWLYENRLARPDSALDKYRMLVQVYGASTYASAVRRRIATETSAPDTVKTQPKVPLNENQIKKSEQKKPSKDSEVIKD